MPLRPIDAIFVNPEKRLYVVYLRGELWQLSRMKITDTAWQRRQPYHGDTNSLYLCHNQNIADPILAQKLRTLNLPHAVRGSTLPRFEAWWETHGFEWVKQLINQGQSPLAAHQTSRNLTDSGSSKQTNVHSEPMVTFLNKHETEVIGSVDIFADMLNDLSNEIRYHRS